MDEGQRYGSEPSRTPPPEASVAPPGSPGAKLGVPAMVLAAIALAIALITMVAFPGPAGPAGPEGPQGPSGAGGDDGADGDDGVDGADGSDGADGVACWDLNGNGIGEVASEDFNGDMVVNVLDCTGPQGPVGPAGAGTLMDWAWANDPLVVPSICTHLTGQEVTITAPSDGTVIVYASELANIDHTVGAEDEWRVGVALAQNDCDFGLSQTSYWRDNIPAGTATDSTMPRSGTFFTAFPVTSGSTTTFYVNAIMWRGSSGGDSFNTGTVMAIFYPS